MGMEALLASLAAKYGYEVALKMLGLDKRTDNPKYAISLGGMNLNPINMMKRIGVNQGIKAITQGGLLPSNMSVMAPLMLGGALGLGYLTNPLREGSYNYNPYLGGQIDYLSEMDGMIGRDQSSGLMKYGANSVLAGKNVISGFGTNDYRSMLDKRGDYFAKQKEKKGKLTEGQQKKLDDTYKEIDQYELSMANKELEQEEKARNRRNYAPPHIGNVHDYGNNNVPDRPDKSGKSGHTNPGARSYGPHFARGGIAGLWPR